MAVAEDSTDCPETCDYNTGFFTVTGSCDDLEESYGYSDNGKCDVYGSNLEKGSFECNCNGCACKPTPAPTMTPVPTIKEPTPAPSVILDCYTLNMYDSYGDGWGGAKWKWKTNMDEGNIKIKTGTLYVGASGTDEICTSTSQEMCYSFVVSSNTNYPTEVSWDITTSDGTIWASGGAGTTVEMCPPTVQPTATPAPTALEPSPAPTMTKMPTVCNPDCQGTNTCQELDEQYGTKDDFCDIFGADLEGSLYECDCNGCACNVVPPSPSPTMTLKPTERPSSYETDECFTLHMFDTYGDGWNDAKWKWKAGGTHGSGEGDAIQYGTLGYGWEGTDEICTTERLDCYDLVVTEGGYPSEISWNLTAADGSLWAHGGAGEDVTLCGPTPVPTMTYAPTNTNSPSIVPTISVQPTYTHKPTDIAQCYTLEMDDSYGDGWNGAAYSWYNARTGHMIANGTMVDGYYEEQTVCGTTASECYTLQITSGWYDYEIDWKLVEADGTTWAEGGAPYEETFCAPSPNPTATPMPSSKPTTPAPSRTFAPTAEPTMTSMPTEGIPVDTCYTLSLHDTYGDGWNGAYWSWINDYNGAVLRSGTVYYGYDQTEEICTYTNSDCYTLKTSGGTYDEEISWKITTLGSDDDGFDNTTGKLHADAGLLAGGVPGSSAFCKGSLPTSEPTYSPEPTSKPTAAPVPAPSYTFQPTAAPFQPVLDACYVLEMYDDWGDGWNEAYFTWTYNRGDLEGEVIKTGTLDYDLAYSGTDTLCTYTHSDCYQFEIGAGYYPSEITWKIITADGNLWASGGPSETVSICGPSPAPTALPTAPSASPTVSLKPTTELVENNCYTLTMKDEESDGWDNAYWYWKNGDSDAGNGNIFDSGTLEDGASSTVEICSYTRVGCYDFMVTNGNYPTEVSWTIESKKGKNMYDVDGKKAKGGAGESITFCNVPTPSPTYTFEPTKDTKAPTSDDTNSGSDDEDEDEDEDDGGGGGGGGSKSKTSDVSPVYLVAGAGILLAGVAFKGGSWVKDRNRRRRREANMAYGNTGVEMGSPNAGAPMAMATAFSVDGNAGMLAPPTPQGGALAITNGPAAEEPMAASSVQNLTTLLVQAQLARYEPALRGLGVAEPADMEAVDDDTLKSVGLNAIEIARLRRNITASSQANQLALMPQVQATATALAPTQQAMPMNKSPAHAKPGKGTRIAPL